MTTTTVPYLPLDVRDLGRIAYDDALIMQRDLQHAVIDARASEEAGPGYLLLLEHDPPVITISRRRGARDHLLANDVQLRAHGVAVAETDRGGDITYHGPGQLVAYAILDLNVLGLRLHSYMRFLEQIVIDALAAWGIKGQRDTDATGVWLDDGKGGSGPKICAMGVRVSRWVSMHGLALNINTALEHFDLIVPCGLAGRRVTSVRQQLGDTCPSMADAKSVLSEMFRTAVVRQISDYASRHHE